MAFFSATTLSPTTKPTLNPMIWNSQKCLQNYQSQGEIVVISYAPDEDNSHGLIP